MMHHNRMLLNFSVFFAALFVGEGIVPPLLIFVFPGLATFLNSNTFSIPGSTITFNVIGLFIMAVITFPILVYFNRQAGTHES